MNLKAHRLLVAVAVLLTAAVAFAAQPLLITGAGATFPYPLYSKWFNDYNVKNPNVRINYQSIGSGGGIKQVTEKTVDFGASDAPMTDAELQKAPGIVHIPTVLGAVVLVANLPGVTDLKLTPDTLSGLYLGKITKWNDPALVKDNPGVKLPDQAVVIVHRADGSGTSAIFTDYLAKVSPEWKTKVGAGKSVKWPVGLGGKGNEGVTGLVKATPGTLGYVELAYANQNKLSPIALKNHDGAFVKPSLEATSAAAATAVIPADYRVSITDAPGKASYPISAFTYLLVDRNAQDAQKAKALQDFLEWAIHDGQKAAPTLDYAPLPKAVVSKVEATLKQLRQGGQAAHGSN